MICGVTGHRQAFPHAYLRLSPTLLRLFARMAITYAKPNKVLTGMALGWDTACAQACEDLKIPFVAVLPFPGQANSWSPQHYAEYRRLLEVASDVVTVSKHRLNEAYFERNRYIVDRSDSLLALYCMGQQGGTRHCVEYAQERRVPVDNYWNRWERYLEQEAQRSARPARPGCIP